MNILENAFIYHKGGGSFGNNSAKQKALIAKNKKYLKKKHGRQLIFWHQREHNLNVLSQYGDVVYCESSRNELKDRIQNRITFANNLMPKGWVKRFKYFAKYKEIKKRLIRG